jgi:hypothetical protein
MMDGFLQNLSSRLNKLQSLDFNFLKNQLNLDLLHIFAGGLFLENIKYPTLGNFDIQKTKTQEGAILSGNF